jgi:hypothetical protein
MIVPDGAAEEASTELAGGGTTVVSDGAGTDGDAGFEVSGRGTVADAEERGARSETDAELP